MKRMLAGALALAATTTISTLVAGDYAHASPAYVLPSPDVSQAARIHVALPLTEWTVGPGQTLSSIAEARYGTQKAWPIIYWANREHIRWADRIRVGQRLTLPIWNDPIPAGPKLTSPPPPPPLPAPVVHRVAVTAPHRTYHITYRKTPHRTYSRPYARTYSRTYHPTYNHTYTHPTGTYSGSGAMERCIIRAESGGNSQVMNASGHYGLYQFSAGTWVASGGSAGSFGHASVAEQQRVFHTAVAARGYSDWTPYDGC